MVKSHYYTVGLWGPLCVYFLIHMTPLGGRPRALFAHRLWHPLAGCLWVMAAEEGGVSDDLSSLS